MDDQKSSKGAIIKSIYFYLVSFVALMMVVFSTADIINIILKTYVFTKADNYAYSYPTMDCTAIAKTNVSSTPEQITECEKNNVKNAEMDKQNRVAENQRSIVRDISMVVVGIPLFVFHWRFIRKKQDE